MDRSADPFDLQRFVDAQQPLLAQVLDELRSGHKRSHWMWYVFPQLQALGRSPTAHHFGLASAAEALGYWRHPLLGPRLLQCTQLVLDVPGRSAQQIFGTPDVLKFCSSMTLFEQVAAQQALFAQALQKYYDGRRDPLTLAWLERSATAVPPPHPVHPREST